MMVALLVVLGLGEVVAPGSEHVVALTLAGASIHLDLYPAQLLLLVAIREGVDHTHKGQQHHHHGHHLYVMVLEMMATQHTERIVKSS